MATYDSDIATANELIQEAGEPVKVITIGHTAGDHPWNPGQAVETVEQGFAVFLNFSMASARDSGEFRWNGTLVQAGDKKVLLATAGLAAAPTVTSFVERADGSRWSVVNHNVLDPNGQHILYTLQVRK